MPIWKRKGGVHDLGEYRGMTYTTQSSIETVGEGFRRTDQEKSRR